MALRLKPIGYKVVIRRREHADRSKGGIIYTDAQKSVKQPRGEVIALGQDLDNPDKKFPVKVGDDVIFNDYAAGAVPEQKELCSVRVEDIIAIVEEDGEPKRK